ncbi:MAG TPA: TRC40/GET3/ArsA family transport-energizing ATPase [Candidatus Lokiarchaeia archaeon]|nr:TRC40/GET3/ArsA family transport-energizing ATPase [Candidatus Lokiarchaeia archaeon]
MTIKDLILRPSSHFILFGGKGGVGKTTSAAAAAVWAADHGKKVLIISTDPAHSLGDSLGFKFIPGETMKVDLVENLWGLELNPKMDEKSQAMLQDPEFTTSFEGGLPFLEDFADLGGMNPPGIDEAMAFGKVLEYVGDENLDFDLIIFDTAPTGHTLRLLSIPEILTSWMGKLIKLQLKLKNFMGAMRGLFKKNKPAKDNSLELMEKLKESVEKAKDELNDPTRTEFIIILIPESMAIYETERLLSSLIMYEIPSSHIIVNQLIPENGECRFCSSRRNMQQKHLAEIHSLYDEDFNITEMPLFDNEINQIDALREVAKILMGEN